MAKKIFVLAAAICAIAAAIGGCVRFISDTGGYYIPSDLAQFSSVTCEADGKTVKVQKKDGYYIAECEGETFVLAENTGAKFSGDKKEELTAEQSRAALYNLISETGLVYAALDKKGYIMTDTSGKYRAEAEKFFYAAEFRRAALEDRPLENFPAYFERSAPEKFGDFDDYEITLDCSRQNSMSLKIENTRRAEESKYIFKDVNETEIPVTAQMKEFIEEHTLSA